MYCGPERHTNVTGWDSVTKAGASILALLANRARALSRAEVARALDMHPRDLVPHLSRLIDGGHIAEVPRDKPRPNYAPLIAITDKGRAAREQKPATRTKKEPTPTKAMPEVPASVRRFRGIAHPPQPQPGKRPTGMSEREWKRATAYQAPFEKMVARWGS